jgi:hypothetical protein
MSSIQTGHEFVGFSEKNRKISDQIATTGCQNRVPERVAQLDRVHASLGAVFAMSIKMQLRNEASI